MEKAFEAFNVTNYREHPDNPRYMVFFFKETHMADYFESRLKKDNIWFERDITERKDGSTLYLFGVKRNDYEKVVQINFDTFGKLRNRTIPGKFTGVLILILTLIFVTLGVMGYVNRT